MYRWGFKKRIVNLKTITMQQKLTAYLKANNITLYEFCKVNGFKYSTAQNWVKGKSLPSYENLEKLNKIIK